MTTLCFQGLLLTVSCLETFDVYDQTIFLCFMFLLCCILQINDTLPVLALCVSFSAFKVCQLTTTSTKIYHLYYQWTNKTTCKHEIQCILMVEEQEISK